MSLIEEDIPGVFIDSWSQRSWNIDDPYQQKAWNKQTTKLWELSLQNNLFQFNTVQDVLVEINELRRKKREVNEENQSLKEVIATLINYATNISDDVVELKVELVS